LTTDRFRESPRYGRGKINKGGRKGKTREIIRTNASISSQMATDTFKTQQKTMSRERAGKLRGTLPKGATGGNVTRKEGDATSRTFRASTVFFLDKEGPVYLGKGQPREIIKKLNL